MRWISVIPRLFIHLSKDFEIPAVYLCNSRKRRKCGLFLYFSPFALHNGNSCSDCSYFCEYSNYQEAHKIRLNKRISKNLKSNTKGVIVQKDIIIIFRNVRGFKNILYMHIDDQCEA